MTFADLRRLLLLIVFLITAAISCWYAFPMAGGLALERASEEIFAVVMQRDDVKNLLDQVNIFSIKLKLTPYFILGIILGITVFLLGKIKDFRNIPEVISLSRILSLYVVLVSLISMILIWLDITIWGWLWIRVGYFWETCFLLHSMPK
ncbi:hypothetical protein DRP53_07120 [candidate division WOR-3 bacterium]|uniref:Uncharacterized protein n=1 Tax=candidate division WOR-3 bacterium TaxID=2052148 RepID=A0A660SG31_UNCW3|nr:MAG: hypothetical protein DRP53_07120 [candidate division WOR-3 bacterium]